MLRSRNTIRVMASCAIALSVACSRGAKILVIAQKHADLSRVVAAVSIV